MKCIVTEWSTISSMLNTFVCLYIDVRILSREVATSQLANYFANFYRTKILIPVIPRTWYLFLSFDR